MYSSADSGSLTEQSASLPGSDELPSADLRVSSRALRAAMRARIAVIALVALALEVDEALVDRVLRLVDVRDEVLDPALVTELHRLAVRALVDEPDQQAAREERRLAQALRDRACLDLELLEDLGVGMEAD